MPIDLRSDTVTRPTPEMRRAMAEAEVGDDLFGEDPTVAMLEAETAALLGKEAAMFVPSGTMANQIAIRLLTQPGDEVLMEDYAHPFHDEAGGAAVISGVTLRLLPGVDGLMTPETVRAAIRPPDIHFAVTRLVCVENTANMAGGRVLPIERVAAVAAVAREAGLNLHLDGARLWNATAASGTPEAEFAAHFDTVSVCFSKGLGAPVGSALAGSRPLIQRARRVRKMLGGSMRQAGIIAAGALYALKNHRDRLIDDHARARWLGEALAAQGWDVAPVETNMVFVRTPDAFGVERRLGAEGIRFFAVDADRVRLVTHLDIDDAAIAETISAFGRARATVS